jgi:nitrite reductase/ring-hydroxylating ferredoxin subunit/Fe-S cluster biogenesis protein NfuA
MTMNNGDAHEQDAEEMVAQLNALVEELEHYPDSEGREKALDLVQIIVTLYGEALRRVIETIHSLPAKDHILAMLSADDVVRAMLTIHGLLPVDLRDRVEAALDEFRGSLISQGADAELMAVDDGVARLRLMRSGKGAPSIAVLKTEIEKHLMEAAPDLAGVEIDGLAEQIEATAKAALHLKSLIAPERAGEPQPAKLFQIKRPQPDKSRVAGAWVPVIRTSGVQEGQFRVISFGEHSVLVCKINGEFYGYRNSCVAGGRPLDDAILEPPLITCACHGYRFDLRRNGACVEKPELRLESLPLIVEDEKVKVAL